MDGGMCDVVVVGNGIIGLSTAFELSQRAADLRISVIGPPAREGAASVAAGAMLNCFGEATVSTLGDPASIAKFAVTRAALDAWPAWLDKLCDAADGTRARRSMRQGTFIVLGAGAAESTISNFHAIRSALATYDEPFEEVVPAEIKGMAPEVNSRPVRALHLPREGAIDAREVLALLERALTTRGVDVIPGTVEQLVISDGRVHGVRLADGETMSAPTVVVAAGSLTQRFIEQLPPGAVPLMLHGTGLGVLTQRHDAPGFGFGQVVRTPNQSGACGLHLVPLDDLGHEYIGGTNLPSFLPSAGPSIGVSFNLLRRACEDFDHRLGYSRIHRWLVGRRPVTLDGFPLLGAAPSCRGLVFATGTYRDGFHSSPVIAAHLADVVLERAVAHPYFDHFVPERPPIERTSVAAAIDEFVVHENDDAVMLGIRLPYCVDPESISGHYRRTAEDVYSRMAEPIALLPEILNAVNNEPSECLRLLNPYLRAVRERYGARVAPHTPQRAR
ncbi:NAD(P)/FAD-dependent oxidoreductase [Streptomyces aureoverticillatus]|uniref:NAD(P)/FAD-dependent oxidoreductase n=1 Tax=Streptomyces aureoverticillatus TaxID=66871 RepID=UPI0013DC8224|nr:FAD-binding oxidoreductase [Streptomyces aureoverticillatus]QIB48399.1 FAD-binding oxidoreductase [Streptomyces aureoverticillatus]